MKGCWFRGTLAVTAVVLSSAVSAQAQQLMGLVVQKSVTGGDEPVFGANVYWLGTTVGTTTRENGVFLIDRVAGKEQLVISFIGFETDTITVGDQTSLKVELVPIHLQEVTIEGWKPSSGLDHSRSTNTVVMMEKELFKAACCNLSESFETNPAVDVAFTDAVTGTRQIQMLGLAGPNTMISIENMPGVRGLASSQGIQFIPGTWINSIEVTKGIGSVVNGYESIAGQINVEMKKPQESEKLYLNAYVNQSGRSELNANYTAMVGNKLATTFLLHGSARPFEMDQNGDSFLDFPTGSQLNVINRWVFKGDNGWLGQFGVKVLKDDRYGGQTGFDKEEDKFTTNRYGLAIISDRTEVWGKIGYQFPGAPYKSIGLQLSGSAHDHDSYFGFTTHEALQRSAYANLIYQSIIGSTNHKFKTGISFLFDDYDERLVNADRQIRLVEDEFEDLVNIMNFDRTERVPGAFLEYTYDLPEKFTAVAGVRVDHHNLVGTVFTPRLHMHYHVTPTTSLRLSAGKGMRLANLLVENTGLLASARQIVFSGMQTDYAYRFKPEKAWNYGVNLSRDFTLGYRPGSILVDYYFTDFENQVVVDMDKSVREANFYALQGDSYSHSLQFQVDYELIRRLDVRLAYRFLDVKTDYAVGRFSRPLIASHRAFANIAYETKNKWKFDYTVQWLGKQRVPTTVENPDGFRLPSATEPYVLMNAQVTKDLKDRWSLYLGVENVTNFRLNDPIISADKPFSPYFDSSLVWGPIFGRMTYFGVRYRIQ